MNVTRTIRKTILKEDLLKVNYILFPEKLHDEYNSLKKINEENKAKIKRLEKEIKRLEFFVIKKK